MEGKLIPIRSKYCENAISEAITITAIRLIPAPYTSQVHIGALLNKQFLEKPPSNLKLTNDS